MESQGWGTPAFRLVLPLLMAAFLCAPAQARDPQLHYVEDVEGAPALPSDTVSVDLALPSLDDARANPAEVNALRDAAEQAISSGEHLAAIELYNEALALAGPNGNTNVDLKLGLALALAGASRTDEALALVDEIYSSPQAYALAQLTKAQILMTTGDRGTALDLVEQVLVHAPAHPEALALRRQLGGALPGDALVEGPAAPADPAVRDAERAVLAEAAQRDPTDAAAWHELGLHDLWAGRHSDAIAGFERALALDPNLHEARLGVARAYLYSGDHDGAQYVFSELLDTDGLDPQLYTLAVGGAASALRASGRRDEAEGAFREALARNPEDTELRLAYAYTLAEGRKLSQALYELSIVERQWPGDQRPLLASARAHAWNGHFDEALCLYEAITDEALQHDALLGRAYVLFWMGRRSDARELLARVCALDPTSADALTLQDLLDQLMRPMLTLAYRVSEDSDDNEHTGLRAVLNFPLDPDGSAIALSHEQIQLDNSATGQSSEGSNTRISVTGVLDPDTTLRGYAGQVDLDNLGDPDTTNFDYGASLTRRVDADWTFSAGFHSNLLYDTPELARSGVVLERFDVGTVFGLLDADTTLAFDYSSGELSDDNTRQEFSFNLRRRSVYDGRGELAYGLAGRYLSFASQSTSGYFSPDKYQFAEVYLDWVDLSERVVKFDASLGLGFDKVEDQDLRNAVRWALGLRADVTERLILRAGVAYSEQAGTAAQSGQDYNHRTYYFSGDWTF